MLRLLHTADWQIGRQYQRFEPEDAAALSEARFTVVERIARHAAQGDFDAVLVAGDVFDAQTVKDRTIRRLFNAMEAYGGPWIMIPGNHDAALAQSVWTRARELGVIPDNVHVLLVAEPVVFADRRFVALPAPLTQRHTSADLTAWFDHAATADGLFRIGLAHGSVQGILADDIDSTNPIAPDRSASARLDYLALGDWHGFRRINDRTWYSGTPESDRFRNNESGYILEVEIDAPGGSPRVNAVRVGQHIWESWRVELTVSSDVDVLLDRLQTLTADHILELSLSGRIDLADQARLAEGMGAAEARLRAMESDMTGLLLHPTAQDIAALHADGYLADVLETLQQMQGNADAAGHGTGDGGGVAGLAGDEGSLDQATVARDALVLLAGMMNEAQS